MAKKIFSLNNNTKTDETGWFVSTPMTSQQLNDILTDNQGVATSIPSPFARIDLVKAAFKWVVDNGIKGSTAHHKLVSYALDVAQLFFLSQKYPEITIVEWSPTEKFSKLKNGQHKEIFETIETFWNQDGEVYNFNRVNKLYLLFYNKKLVGGTSPATLFFAAPDITAKKIKMNITAGNHRLLGNTYASLDEREFSFIKYMFAIKETDSFRKFLSGTGFDELHYYLEEVLKKVPQEQLNSLNQLNKNSINNYDKCLVSNSAANYCDILGIPLGLAKEDRDRIELESDFTIFSSLSDKKPLILPNEAFNEVLKYTTNDVVWDDAIMRGKVPSKNEKSEENSRLPRTQHNYFWLSRDNFLEEEIIELPYPINTFKFETCGSSNYLLPLSKTFFEYFKVEDIPNLVKLRRLAAGGVSVDLEIPIKNNKKIVYSKIYNNTIKIKTHLAIFPFVKTSIEEVNYNIGLIDADLGNNTNNKIELTFLKEGEKVESTEQVIRNGVRGVAKSSYTSTTKMFDAIQMDHNGNKGVIVPLMPEYYEGASSFNFAIDFGTTNTHIEFNKDGEVISAFYNEPNKEIWASLLDFHNEKDGIYKVIEKTFEQEIMPLLIGRNGVSFPLRSALVENDTVNYKEETNVFKHLNNFLLYEKTNTQGHLKLVTNLKWSNYSLIEDSTRVKAYVEYLISLTFYKVLLSNGNLEKTKITWFYPVSMPKYTRNNFSEIWIKKYNEVFGDFAKKDNLKSLPESVAPFYFYNKKQNVLGQSVSIDIGGGTTDIAVFDGSNADLISSFRFAGDAIFGDGYGGSPSCNGYVLKYKPVVESYIESLKNETKNKKAILNNILDRRSNSSDFSSYLFALEKESNDLFSYSSLLKEDRYLKLNLLIFYGAIAYYLARIHKIANIKLPKNFLFSGTGSKSLYILDNDPLLENVSSLFRFVFEKVFENNYPLNTNTIIAEAPKEITCKGGLLHFNEEIGKTLFWPGLDLPDYSERLLDNSEKNPDYLYKYIDDEATNRVISEVEIFYNIIDKFEEKVNIANIFGINNDAYQVFKSFRMSGLDDFIYKGIKMRKEEIYQNGDTQIEESLFFYPLVGLLNKLALELSKLNQ